MPTERSSTFYLVATLLVSNVHLCILTRTYNGTTQGTSDKDLTESLCLSRCSTPNREHTKTTSSSYSPSPPQLNVKDSNCYRNCMEDKQQPKKGIKRSATNEASNNWKYDCSDIQATERKIGDIKDLSVKFVQVKDKDENMTWVANVTWDFFFLNQSMFFSDEWKGFLITWAKPTESPASVLVFCQSIPKNTTNYIIKSGSTDWVYPEVIDVRVLINPPTQKMYNGFSLERFDPKGPKRTTMQAQNSPVLPIFFGCLVGGIIVCAVSYLAWKRKNKNNNNEAPSQGHDRYEYDASILYSTLDEEWVTTELIPLLETQNNFKCFIHFRDFEIGRVLHENMADAVNKCRKNLAVVSNNFLNSNYCKDELHMALERVQRLGDCSLIVLNLDGVPKERLPEALLVRTFVNLTNAQEQNTWKNRLVRQISVENPQNSYVRIQENTNVALVLDESTCQVGSVI